MYDDYRSILDYLNYLIGIANAPGYSSVSSILTFLSILIISGTISHVFMRFIKNRYIGFLVSSVCSIWLYEQVFVRGLSLVDFLISVILLLAFLAVISLLVFAIFIKKVPVPFKVPPKF